MLDRIRSAFGRTRQASYTPEQLSEIGRALTAQRKRLREIRALPIDQIDRLYRETTGR